MLAIGGDLSPPRLLNAYANGIFPWFEPEYPLLWWSPDPRLIIKPSAFKISRSLQQTLKKPYRITIDTVFPEVIQACATTGTRVNNTWITADMIDAYTLLNSLGYAHSFEVWDESTLIGGLYGISLGHAFFGESMFHYQRDASKVAFYHLCQTMLAWGFDFIDCQLPTAHLQRLGAEVLERRDFLKQLQQSLQQPTRKGNWRIDKPRLPFSLI